MIKSFGFNYVHNLLYDITFFLLKKIICLQLVRTILLVMIFIDYLRIPDVLSAISKICVFITSKITKWYVTLVVYKRRFQSITPWTSAISCWISAVIFRNFHRSFGKIFIAYIFTNLTLK